MGLPTVGWPWIEFSIEKAEKIMNVKTLSLTLLMTFVVVGLIATSQTFAQGGVRDAGSKMRGDYGGSSRSMARSRSFYQPSVPMAVREAPQVARAPSAERRYSIETAPQAATCPHAHAAPAAPQAAERAPTARRYSYEPSAESTRVYRAPATRRGFGGSGVPDAGSKMRGDYGR